jgi:type I restriction enzyme S subunit
MNKWKKCKLGEVITLNYGKSLPAKKRNGGDIPVYSSAGLTGWHNKALVDSKGLIIGRKGTIGKVYKSEIPFYAIDTSYYVLPNNDVYDFDFLFFLLCSIGLDELNEDSAVPGLNRNTAYSQKISLPSLPEQRAIASVLSSLDDKIDLLHRQNKTLEAMAETLFRQWFIEEAKEDWEEKILFDISEHKKVNIRPDKNLTIEYNHYSIPAFDKGENPVKELGIEIKSNKYKIFENSILISKLNPRFPRVWSIWKEFENKENPICSTEFQIVYPNKKEYFSFIYYLLKSSPVTNELIGAASGTSGSHQRVKPQDIFNISFLFNENKAIEFHNLVKNNLDKIKDNKTQIITLEKLRDTLLPKLMSGEVRVEI